SLSLILVFAFASAIIAQDGLPTNAEPGKCYAKCYIADQWKTETETVMSKEASKRMEATPAKYKTITETVLSKEAGKSVSVIPAKYETRTERVLIKEESKKIIIVSPAKYETRTETMEIKAPATKIETTPAKYVTKTETMMVEAATTKWVKQKDAMCQAGNSNDCMVWCLVEVPAQYKTITKRVLATAAASNEVTIPGRSKTITKRIMVTPPVTREEVIPAEYKTITKTVMVAGPKTVEKDIPAQYQTITKTVVDVPASVRAIEIPAEYKTVTKRVLVKAGGFSEYREVVCSKNVTSQLVRQVQRALLAKGYTVGPAGTDNVLGKDTRAALIKYQKDNNLPVGNMNVETMKHLGIKGY
ncbi:MAG: hypothetical protein ACJAR8_001719, partial [Bacteroidia bacterium]